MAEGDRWWRHPPGEMHTRVTVGSGGPLPRVLLTALAGDPGQDGHDVPLRPSTHPRCHPVLRG